MIVNEQINIASRLDAKGFKQAETATQKLGKSAKNLAASLGLAFGTAKLVSFAKQSIKAAVEAQAEQNRLATLMRTTVGASSEQIASLNEQTAALEKLGVVTGGSITQVQSQLATFNLQTDTIKKLTPAILDYVTAEKGATASAAEFKSMTNGLAQALNGNFASLTRVGFVIDEVTRNTIKNGTEAERTAAIVEVLDSTYKGFNESLRATPAGQMQVLANAAAQAQVIIGTGLLDALIEVGKDTSIEDLAVDMETAALNTADFIRGLGEVGKFKLNGETKNLIGLLTTPFKRSFAAGPLGAISRLGERSRLEKDMFNFASGGGLGTGSTKSMTDKQEAIAAKKLAADEKARAKAAAAAASAAAKLLKAQKDQTKALKEQAKLKKANTLFDIEQAGIIAALQGDISREERIRLQLQLAILTENVSAAQRLAGEVAKSQGLTQDLVNFYSGLPDAKNPFKGWLETILSAKSAAEALAGINIGASGAGSIASPASLAALAESALDLAAAADVDKLMADIDKLLNGSSSGNNLPGTFKPYLSGTGDFNGNGPVSVTVMLDGQVMAGAISNVQTNNSLSGSQVALNRNLGSFAV
jgi:hypothetical protein